MATRKKLRALYYANLLLITSLLGYQLYLHLSEPDFQAAHFSQLQAIQTALQNSESFQFAVVGNVNNSHRKFRDQIIPIINNSDAQFTVSAGNAVSSGSVESYRSAYKMFSRLTNPWLLTYGSNEDSDFGNLHFYERFGPHFYAFTAGNSHFLFLDNTGHTPLDWQLNWLERELTASRTRHRFVFISAPLHKPQDEVSALQRSIHFENEPARQELFDLFERHQVDAVFSSELSVFHDISQNGVRYITTGGAGGLIVDDEQSFHHYVKVNVTRDSTDTQVHPLDLQEPSWLRTLDSIWSAIYTLFYVSYTRFLIIIAFLVLASLKLREILFEERDYYAHLSIDDSGWRNQPKRVLMFTNNFFPFVSGVTVSIERLIRGLKAEHHSVAIVAPDYHKDASCDDTLRVKTLVAFGSKQEFRLANLFSPRIGRFFSRFKPDIVHLHHPFWLGSAGLWLARRHKVPAVYTYHTRLEMYAHYVPIPGRIFRNVISHVLIRRFCNNCDGVIVPTVSTEEYLRLIGVKTPLCVQPTGIDFERFNQPCPEQVSALRAELNLPNQGLTLISVSRLGKEKSVDFLIRAMPDIIARTDKPLRLIIVGEGDQRPELEALIRELGLVDTVMLIGSVEPEAIATYYQAADLFVFASQSETQGMVLLEAMAAGLPVVAVRSSGTADVVVNGETGYITLAKRSVWSEKVIRLIREDDERARFSSNAIALAREHDTAVFARNIDQFYSEILSLRDQP